MRHGGPDVKAPGSVLNIILNLLLLLLLRE